MKSIKRGVSVLLMGIGLAMLLSALFWGAGGGLSAQVATTDPVLVGAGDIATAETADTATANLVLDTLLNTPATVFTVGDNASEDSSQDQGGLGEYRLLLAIDHGTGFYRPGTTVTHWSLNSSAFSSAVRLRHTSVPLPAGQGDLRPFAPVIDTTELRSKCLRGARFVARSDAAWG
jgi:hypothetical protein